MGRFIGHYIWSETKISTLPHSLHTIFTKYSQEQKVGMFQFKNSGLYEFPPAEL